MKIKDKEKGISYNPPSMTDEDVLAMDEAMLEQGDMPDFDEDELPDVLITKNNEEAMVKWDAQGEQNFKQLIALQKPYSDKYQADLKAEKERKQKDKTNGAKKDQAIKIEYRGPSYIGERIQFLMEQNNQEIAEFARNFGISRSSMHRYIKGSYLPSEKTLRRIIEGLYVSVADFSYKPTDFADWKSSFESSYNNDIYKFRDKMLNELRINSFTYQYKDMTLRLPNRYFELLRNLIKSSFDILEMIPHDK